MSRLPRTIDPDLDVYHPADRPLGEPPILDYERFVSERRIPSDARLKRL